MPSRATAANRPGCGRDRLRRTALACLCAALLAQPGIGSLAWNQDRLLALATQSGPATAERARALLAVVNAERPRAEPLRLEAVNRFFNERIVFADDLATTGSTDQWASPLELLARGTGDCEDFAIAKYFALIAAGVPSARLRMVYVRAELGGVAVPHMVLAYYAQPSAEPLVLDNLRSEIVAASKRPDLHPVFSFNAEGLWQGTAGASGGDPSARLSRWREVIAKARAEGFI